MSEFDKTCDECGVEFSSYLAPICDDCDSKHESVLVNKIVTLQEKLKESMDSEILALRNNEKLRARISELSSALDDISQGIYQDNAGFCYCPNIAKDALKNDGGSDEKT